MKWEYKTEYYRISDLPSERSLNYYGDEGWELITTIKGVKYVAFYFKHIKPNQNDDQRT